MRAMLLAFLLTACGGKPIAANVPQPNKAAAAGIAGGAAAAMTLLDPDGAAKRQEENKPDDEKREQRSKGDVPPDVLDRLDSKPAAEPAPRTSGEDEEQAPDPYGLSKKKPAAPAKPKKQPTVFTPQK
jgi:hypothetical protein